MKMTRRAIGDPSADHAARRSILGELLEAADDHVALQLGDMVYKKHAIEMIDLMLEAGCEQTFGGDLLHPPGTVQIIDRHGSCALDFRIVIGNGKAAFLV